MTVTSTFETGGRSSIDAAAGRAVHIFGPLAVLTALTWTAFALSPWLIQWPLLLIALNPRMLFLILVAPRLGLWEFTAVATLRLCVADPFSYLMGVRYGGRVRDRLERSRLRAVILRIMRAERTACFVGVCVRPSQVMLVWAGSLRLSPRAVAISDVVTTVIYVIAVHEGASRLL